MVIIIKSFCLTFILKHNNNNKFENSFDLTITYKFGEDKELYEKNISDIQTI